LAVKRRRQNPSVGYTDSSLFKGAKNSADSDSLVPLEKGEVAKQQGDCPFVTGDY